MRRAFYNHDHFTSTFLHGGFDWGCFSLGLPAKFATKSRGIIRLTYRFDHSHSSRGKELMGVIHPSDWFGSEFSDQLFPPFLSAFVLYQILPIRLASGISTSNFPNCILHANTSEQSHQFYADISQHICFLKTTFSCEFSIRLIILLQVLFDCFQPITPYLHLKTKSQLRFSSP